MTILVTGATGSVGRSLVDALVAGGEAVRALSRTPAGADLPEGVEVVGPDDGGLFHEVEAMFVFPLADGVDDLVSAAVGAGVGRFVVLSSLAAAVEFPRDRGSASATHHLAVERAVTARTDDWTILRPGAFANNLLAWAWTIKSGAPIRAPHIHSAQAPIHEADITDAAAATLVQDGHTGKTYPLTGPQSLTRVEQVAALGAGLGRELHLVEISPEEFRADTAPYVPEGIVSMLLDYWSDTVTEPDRVRPGVPELTGKPGRTLEQWARDHRADFSAA